MRRPHLTCRVQRGLEILADGGIAPLLRSPKQKRDAARATEWIEANGRWRQRQRLPAVQDKCLSDRPSKAGHTFGQLSLPAGLKLKSEGLVSGH